MGGVLVSCFHLETVDRVHELAPGLATAWLVFDAREPGPLIERTVAHGHVAIHPNQAFITAGAGGRGPRQRPGGEHLDL